MFGLILLNQTFVRVTAFMQNAYYTKGRGNAALVNASLWQRQWPLGVTVDPCSFMQNTFFGSTNVSGPVNSICPLNCLNIPTEKTEKESV